MRRRDGWLLLLAVCLCLAVFCRLAFLSDFPKAFLVYPDELRYVHINDSLVNHGGTLLLRDVASSFSKVLYPLALFPAAFFVGSAQYTTVVAYLNAGMVSFLPLLALGLSRLCGLGKMAAVFLMVLAACLPDTIYSLTFMSENLYLPLSTAVILLAWKLFGMAEQGRSILLLSWCFGMASYILYLAKEIGVAFPMAYAALAFLCWMGNRDGAMEKRLAMSAVAAVAGFALPFLFVKLAVLSGLDNSYATMLVPRNGDMGQAIPYLLQVYGIHLVWVLLAFFFFPVVMPLECWHSMGFAARLRYAFLLSCLLLLLAVVSYTVTWNEDYPSMAPRQHLRYYSCFFLPFVALSLQAVEAVSEARRPLGRIVVLLFAFVAALFVIEMPFSVGSPVDQMLLRYVLDWQGTWERYAIAGTVAAIGVAALWRPGQAAFLLGGVMLAVSAWNQSLACRDIHDAYALPREMVAEHVRLAADLGEMEGNVLCLVGTSFMGMPVGEYPLNALLDTYTPNRMQMVSVEAFQMLWKHHPEWEGDFRLSEFAIAKGEQYGDVPGIWKEFYPDYGEASYLLVDRDSECRLDPSRVQFMERYGNCALYRNLDTSRLPYLP